MAQKIEITIDDGYTVMAFSQEELILLRKALVEKKFALLSECSKYFAGKPADFMAKIDRDAKFEQAGKVTKLQDRVESFINECW